MNDLEINKAVAEKLGLFYRKQIGKTSRIWIHYRKDADEADCRGYCSEWDDTGPIIEKYKISLMWCEDTETWSAVKAGDDTTIDDILYDPNPLRAVMLCFLEMEITC